MASHVYLLKHASDPCMKIGKANGVRSRVSTLGAEKFDLDGSWIVRVPDEGTAFDLEKALSKLFKRFNVARPAEVDGRTEWYDLACLDRALRFVEREADLFSAIVLRAAEDPGSVLAGPSVRPHRRRRAATPQEIRAECELARRENDEVMRAFAANLLAFRQVAYLLLRSSGAQNEGAVRLFFLSRPEASVEGFRAAFDLLGSPHHHGGGCLHLPRAGTNLYGGGFLAPAWDDEQLRGYVGVTDPSDPCLLQFVSAESLESLRGALEGLDPCPRVLQEEIEAAHAAFLQRWSTGLAEDSDRVVTSWRKKP